MDDLTVIDWLEAASFLTMAASDTFANLSLPSDYNYRTDLKASVGANEVRLLAIGIELSSMDSETTRLNRLLIAASVTKLLGAYFGD